MAFAAGHGPAPDLAVDDGDTANHAWLNAKQRALTTLGRHEEAIAAGLRSIGLAPAKVEYLFCTANSYAASRLPYGPMLAEGLYREALRLRPRHEPVRRSLAATLRRRGLVEEARAIEQGPG
jgi:tetratricopeptide (TPR) repeat protein